MNVAGTCEYTPKHSKFRIYEHLCISSYFNILFRSHISISYSDHIFQYLIQITYFNILFRPHISISYSD
ncbi:unnamed protein product, partial [Larinioides sclopetarius]